MRQVFLLTVLVFISGLLVLQSRGYAGAIPGDASFGTQLMHNGGLEENNGKMAPGYDLTGFGVKLDSTTAHTGRFSIRTVCDATHTSTFTSPKVALPAPYDHPRRIIVSAWVRARDLTIVHQGGWSAGHLMVWANDAKGEKIKTMNANGWDNVGLGEMTGYFSGTFDWREVKGNFVLPPGTASVSFEGGISYAGGTAWFDDLSVMEVPLEWAPKEAADATVSIDTKTLARSIEGVGWNWSFIWDAPNEMGMSPQVLAQLMHYAEWDQQSFVRFGFLAQRCLHGDMRKFEPVFDPTTSGAAFYKQILTGLNGLNVRLLACNWHYGDGTGPYEKPPYPADRFASAVTVVLRHWAVQDRITNLRWISLWNEPDWWYKFGGNYAGDFPGYWSELGRQLQAVGLYSRIGVVGADTTQGGGIAEQAFPRMDSVAGDSVAAWSAHDYFSSVEAPGRTTSGGIMQPYLRGYSGAVAALQSSRKSMFIGEFGCGRQEEEYSYRGTLGAAELVIGGLNCGVRGFARWVFNGIDGISATATGFSPFTLINGKVEPKRPVYYGYAVITKAVRPGARVAKSETQGGRDAGGTERVHSATVINPDGSIAVLLVNDGLESKSVHLKGLSAAGLNQYWYDSTLPDGLQGGVSVSTSGNDVTVSLKPMSVNALTTWKWGRLKP